MNTTTDTTQAKNLTAGDFVLVPYGSRGFSLAMITGNRTRTGRVEFVKLVGGYHPQARKTCTGDTQLRLATDREVQTRSNRYPGTLRESVLGEIERADRIEAARLAEFMAGDLKPGHVIEYHFNGYTEAAIFDGYTRNSRGKINGCQVRIHFRRWDDRIETKELKPSSYVHRITEDNRDVRLASSDRLRTLVKFADEQSIELNW